MKNIPDILMALWCLAVLVLVFGDQLLPPPAPQAVGLVGDQYELPLPEPYGEREESLYWRVIDRLDPFRNMDLEPGFVVTQGSCVWTKTPCGRPISIRAGSDVQ